LPANIARVFRVTPSPLGDHAPATVRASGR
jgi:hypothetical protein